MNNAILYTLADMTRTCCMPLCEEEALNEDSMEIVSPQAMVLYSGENDIKTQWFV